MRKTKLLSLVLACVLSLSVLAGCGGKDAAPAEYPTPEKPLTIQVGYVPPVGEVCDLTINEIKKEVEEKTEGAVILELFPNSQLGNEKVMLDAIMGGTLDAGLISFAQESTAIPEAACFMLPFAFEDSEHYFRVVQTEEFKEKYNEAVGKKGMTFLGVVNGPARGMIAQKPTLTPEDFKGLKVRIMDGEVFADTFAAWGAGTSVIPFGECYTGIQQGVIDAIDMETTMGVLMKFFEVANVFTATNHVIQGNPFIMSTNVWNKLSPEQQEILKTATANGEEFTKAKYPEIAAKFTEQAINDYDLQVYELTDEQRQAFIDSVQPVYEKHREKIGAEFYDWFMDFVASKAE